MKIVILQDHLRLGGTEAQALALGQQWIAAGHSVQLVVFRPGGKLAESAAAKKLNPKVLQSFNSALDMWAPRLLETVEAMKPDVVVAFGREANVKLPKLKTLSPRPMLVATLRSGRDQPRRFWKALQRADQVITNARWAADAAVVKGVPESLIQVIYSGIVRESRVADPQAARLEWRKRAHTPEGAVVILCVAGFRRGKGQDLLLRAAAKLPPELSWQLWFVGGGTWQVPVMRVAAQLKLKDRVRFAGVVEDPSSLYAAADVAALTSLAEALPNFLIEAQAMGLPVVATAVGGVSECFEDGRTGLAVPPLEPKPLTAALERAIRDRAWREAARAPAMARAAELFDAQRNAAKWIELFAAKRAK